MLSPLYEKNKIWTIECFPNKDGSYSIKTTHGQINGKMIEHIVSVKEGKNIGKKNETSIKEQAELEGLDKIFENFHTRLTADIIDNISDIFEVLSFQDINCFTTITRFNISNTIYN